MAYGYRFELPDGLSISQNTELTQLALSTARNASVVASGAFRRGWTASIRNSILTVSNSVRYAIYLEMGTVYSRQHRFRVRDALNRIGFDTAHPIITDPEIAAEVERANTNENTQGAQILVNETSQAGTGTFQPASNIEGANPLTFESILLPSDDPIDILIKPLGQLNDDIRPTLTYAVNNQQEAIEAYKKILGLDFGELSMEQTLDYHKKLIKQQVPISDLFNKAALIALLAAAALAKEKELERKEDIQSQSGT